MNCFLEKPGDLKDRWVLESHCKIPRTRKLSKNKYVYLTYLQHFVDVTWFLNRSTFLWLFHMALCSNQTCPVFSPPLMQCFPNHPCSNISGDSTVHEFCHLEEKGHILGGTDWIGSIAWGCSPRSWPQLLIHAIFPPPDLLGVPFSTPLLLCFIFYYYYLWHCCVMVISAPDSIRTTINQSLQTDYLYGALMAHPCRQTGQPPTVPSSVGCQI